MQREDGSLPVTIDFDGFGGMGEEIQLEESYGCHVRGRRDAGLYFRRINRSRELWLRDLEGFVTALDTAETEPGSHAERRRT